MGEPLPSVPQTSRNPRGKTLHTRREAGLTQVHCRDGGFVPALVHSCSPVTSLHMYRSVGRPLGQQIQDDGRGVRIYPALTLWAHHIAGNLNKPPLDPPEFPQGRETNQLESPCDATVLGPQQPTGLLKPSVAHHVVC